jgi:hypothetical protein
VTTLEWALAYGSLGWRVFPVAPSAKRPLFAGWQRIATSELIQIHRWYDVSSDRNIGLICGEKFVAVDVEADHLPLFREWLRQRHASVPATPIARTGRGGIHILVNAPAGTGGHALRVDGVHVGELKAAGGFIVACPSRTSGAYTWLRSPLQVPVADAPDWMDCLRATPQRRPSREPMPSLGPTRGEHRLAGLARAVRAATEGQRNDLLYWAVRRAIDDGIPASVAGNVLGRMAIGAGLGETEVARTVDSARGAAAR